MKEKLKDITCNAQWTADCCGKQDLDFGIITADSRYYPDNSVICEIQFLSNFNPESDGYYCPKVVEPITLLKSGTIKGNSEEECKEIAKRWYNSHIIEAMEKAIKVIKGDILVEYNED